LELTVSQYAILSRMVQQPRRVFQPDMILDWINPDGTATDYCVYNHIKRIRQLLRTVALEEDFIKTQHTNGYRYQTGWVQGSGVRCLGSYSINVSSTFFKALHSPTSLKSLIESILNDR
jgi:DNA-binding winged helix-turn-helix (wHTH) protein